MCTIAQRTTPHYVPSSGRIEEVDTLRGFAIFLVVLGHSIIFFPVNLHENFYCEFVFRWLSSVHMPLMFMIAGFCWSCKDYAAYIRKKFLRLVIPYVAFNILDMFPRFLLSSLVRRPRSFGESAVKFLLYGGEYWFLYTLFVIFLIYPLIFRLAGSSRRNMAVFCVLSFVISLHGVSISAFNIGSAAHYMFFFHVGVCMKYFAGGKWPEMKIPAFMLPIMIGVWLAVLFKVKGLGIFAALAGIASCCIVARHEIFRRMFSRFGEYSLQLYLLNGFTLGISRAVICNVLHVSQPVMIIAFNMMIDFFASYMVIKYSCAKSEIITRIMGFPFQQGDSK
ncbi:MAG: acyltransferase [Synergistaceae bacterium]|nr:acyltransferase [Synergistaceae bacterium]